MNEFKATAPHAIDGFFPLDSAQIDQYREQGYLLLRGVASAEEIRQWREVLLPAVEQLILEHHQTGGNGHEQRIMNLWSRVEQVRGFSLAERFGHLANELMGARAVRIYHDQALFKQPGAGFTPLHQDQTLWPIEARTVTMWMPLTDLEPGMGVLRVAAGSHAAGELPGGTGNEHELEALANERGWPLHELEAMKAGDAVFYSGWLIAGTTENQAERTREVMTVIYMDADAKIAEPKNPRQREDLATWLAGRKPGETADTEMNPVVYSHESRRG